jgi:uncharacterized DUF497 family protein
MSAWWTQIRECGSISDDEFEWDDAKAADNLRKHGVAFDHARPAFADPFAVEDVEIVEGEEHTRMIALADGWLLVVVYTDRGARRRIISARRATRREHDRYYFENAQD